jgi:hypothetical protein
MNNNETLILKAKEFATEITIFNARKHGMKSEGQISNEHITNNKAVRKTLLERGIRPETLPPVEDVKKVEIRESGLPALDLSKINFEALAARFNKSKHKNTDLELLKVAIRAQLEKMIRLNRTKGRLCREVRDAD